MVDAYSLHQSGLSLTTASERSIPTYQGDFEINNLLLSVVSKLEQEKQRPVYYCEIYKATVETTPVNRFEILNLFKMDLILADFENN